MQNKPISNSVEPAMTLQLDFYFLTKESHIPPDGQSSKGRLNFQASESKEYTGHYAS